MWRNAQAKSLLWIVLGICSIVCIPVAAAEKATVTSETQVYTEPASNSKTPVRVTAGTVVEIDFEIATAEGSWCRLAPNPQRSAAAFVPCSSLRREPKPPEKSPPPQPALGSLAAGDEVTAFACDEVNIFSWLQRYGYTDQQMQLAHELAEGTGYADCGRRAERFKRAYYPGIPVQEKAELLRAWAAQDPADRCSASYLRFWRSAKELMTPEQRARMLEDTPRMMELIRRTQGSLERCIPLFCLF